jgi:hypothetical protein
MLFRMDCFQTSFSFEEKFEMVQLTLFHNFTYVESVECILYLWGLHTVPM